MNIKLLCGLFAMLSSSTVPCLGQVLGPGESCGTARPNSRCVIRLNLANVQVPPRYTVWTSNTVIVQMVNRPFLDACSLKLPFQSSDELSSAVKLLPLSDIMIDIQNALSSLRRPSELATSPAKTTESNNEDDIYRMRSSLERLSGDDIRITHDLSEVAQLAADALERMRALSGRFSAGTLSTDTASIGPFRIGATVTPLDFSRERDLTRSTLEAAIGAVLPTLDNYEADLDFVSESATRMNLVSNKTLAASDARRELKLAVNRGGQLKTVVERLLDVQKALRPYLSEIEQSGLAVDQMPIVFKPYRMYGPATEQFQCRNILDRKLTIDVPITVTFAEIPRVALSVGAVASTIGYVSYTIVPTSNSSYQLASNTITPQVIPFAFGNVRLIDTMIHSTPISWNVSCGIGVNVSGGTPSTEFAIGAAQGFDNWRISVGTHIGRRTTLAGGYKVGDVVPVAFQPPVTHSFGYGFAIGVSYVLPLNRALRGVK